LHPDFTENLFRWNPKTGRGPQAQVFLIFGVQRKQWWKKMPTDGTLLTIKDDLADNLLRCTGIHYSEDVQGIILVEGIVFDHVAGQDH